VPEAQSFSQRKGLKPVKSIIQMDSMDDDLRVALWNALEMHYWSNAHQGYNFTGTEKNRTLFVMCRILWDEFFKLATDEISGEWGHNHRFLRNAFFRLAWNEVYDFTELAASSYPSARVNAEFIEQCNRVLEREMSGYRFVGTRLADITSKEEIAEIEQALKLPKALKLVSLHIDSALALLTDRESPDYRNSIKESISAVEAICKIVASDHKADFGPAMKAIKIKLDLHPALEGAFSRLYGYTSDAEGIRHALMDEPNLSSEDARFMLVACSAFVNYLVSKASRSGIAF
jgi:hypothetical protein